MKLIVFILIALADLCVGGDDLGHRVPTALVVAGAKQPVINLDGAWKFAIKPPHEFWENKVSPVAWDDIRVPGECAMQGFAIRHDTPFVYKKKFHVPADYAGKVIKLKFDGTYNYARVWVNGHFIREHYNGFTPWECEIADFVTPGKDAWLTVEVTDKKIDLSYGSGYAKHQIGGILRSVWLLALPKNHLKYFYVQTDLDQDYKNATMNIQLEPTKSRTLVRFTLLDPAGEKVKLPQDTFELSGGKQVISISVQNPVKWDAEHPNLYTLMTSLLGSSGEIIYSRSEKIGFREIELHGNKLLINGRPVKLRGACRHDIHPLLGRMTTPEYDKKDVLLAKEANINFIRTSHYPPSASFLHYCDEYGLYVEVESAVCFVGTHRTKGYSSKDLQGPKFKDKYLSQVREMVHVHRNHPSVIIWSVGNENNYNENFKLSYDYIKSVDATRPVMFSYPGGVPDSVKCYDILSMHYPSYRGDIGNQRGISIKNFEYDKMPVLFDEWAHVACYNKPTLLIDPNVRNFWGQSLDSMWTNLFESHGGLGGAIWGMIDETFMLPETLAGFNKWWGIMDEHILPAMYEGPCVGYGEWGIVDTWRRKKPEFWSVKKAYSPTKILVRGIDNFQSGADLLIPVYNRFDHTNFTEIEIQWQYRDWSGTIKDFKLAPHRKGNLVIPAENWKIGSSVRIKFFSSDHSLIDEYNLPIGKRHERLPNLKKGKIQVRETGQQVQFIGDHLTFAVNKKTGLLQDVRKNGVVLIQSGPYINLKIPGKHVYYSTITMDDYATHWKLSNFHYEIKEGVANIYTNGKYDSVAADFHVRMDAAGTLSIDYQVTAAPAGKHLQESGIRLILGNEFNRLAWDRQAYWTAYPASHLGLPNGKIDLHSDLPMEYRQFPDHPWALDRKDFYYLGINYKLPMTNMARAMKENIYFYSLDKVNGSKLVILANGDKACRLDKTSEGFILYIDDQWDYTGLLWGNYMKRKKLPKEYRNSVMMKVE